MVRPVDGSNPSPTIGSTQDVDSADKTAATDDKASTQNTSSSTATGGESLKSTPDSGKQVAEHMIGGQARAAQLQSQLSVREPKGQAADGPVPQGSGQQTKTKSMQDVMKDSGMANVSNPPSEQDLKTYYSTKAPANTLIAGGKYADAAKEYRQLADAATDPAEKQRLTQTARQLDTADRMKTAGVQSLSFPPSETNVKSYFSTMRGKSIGEVKSAFEDYSNSFYIHSETKGVDKGDIKYDEETHNIGNTQYKTTTPEDWDDLNKSREMHTDGRRIIDCEGYALLAKTALTSAGFTQGTYAGALRKDDPNTPEDESLRQHMMYSAQRTVTGPDGKPVTEVIAVSNNKAYVSDTSDGRSVGDAQSNVLTRAYTDTFRSGNKRPGGAIVLKPEPWQVMWELDKQVEQLKQAQ